VREGISFLRIACQRKQSGVGDEDGSKKGREWSMREHVLWIGEQRPGSLCPNVGREGPTHLLLL
jgi:hypothetical protein